MRWSRSSATEPIGELQLVGRTNRFQWDNRKTVTSQMQRYFPRTGFDKWVLDRESVVRLVMQAREKQLIISPGESTNVYISGCRGMGKTCLLELVAKRLKSEGWDVYWFRSASDIPPGVGDAFLTRANAAPQTKIAVIVDEVASNPESGMFTALLKKAPPNIFVIGAAVPRYLPSGASATFRFVLRHSDLVLKDGDTDVSALVEHWKAILAPAVPPQTVDFVCKLVLSYCGGHTYAVLAFMELIFTTEVQKAVLMQGEAAFLKHFYSEEFANNAVYRDICARCFDNISDPLSYKTLVRVLNGSGDSTDVGTLVRLGWWEAEKSTISSTLLLNECLLAGNTEIGNDKKEKLFVDGNKPAQENLELLVVEGVASMEENDFKSAGNQWPIENALSFNWAHRVRLLFGNVHMQFQYPGTGGRCWMDFHVNGNINGVVEVQRNATKGKGSSQDINEHMDRLVSGKYPFKNFVLLNFAMHPKVKVILPDDPAHHNRVFTYQHSTNKLFRGQREIKSPAVHKLISPSSLGGAPGSIIRGVTRKMHTLCRIW